MTEFERVTGGERARCVLASHPAASRWLLAIIAVAVQSGIHAYKVNAERHRRVVNQYHDLSGETCCSYGLDNRSWACWTGPADLYDERFVLPHGMLFTAQDNVFGGLLPFAGIPVTPVTPVKIQCLNTPATGWYSDYPFRCPDTANISDYYDKDGVYHRIIKHAPLKGVTSKMMRWWFSPALTLKAPLTFIHFRGQTLPWYKVWHPIDHEYLLPAVLPGPVNPKLPTLWVIVGEHYRKLDNEPGFPLRVEAPTYVANGRFGVQLRGPGGVVIASFMNLPWVDTPEGLVFSTELIVGINNRGLRWLNPTLVRPTFFEQFPGGNDQVTRHHIEEVSNFQAFLPELYAQYGPGTGLSGLITGAASG